MSVYSYNVFETVVQNGSFSKAAKILNLTPSAISHAISKLEDEFGFPLFIRNRKGVKLTNEGEKILPYVQDVLRSNEKLEQEKNEILGLLSGNIRIGAFNSVTLHWLPYILKSFKNKYPNINIKIYQGGYDDVIYWIKNNFVDLAFVSKTIIDKDSAFEVIPLHRDRLMCVTPKDFKPKNHDYVVIDDIINEVFVMQNTGYDAETNNFLQKYNLRVPSEFQIENDDSIIAMVESGFGICIMPELVPKNTTFDVNVYPIEPAMYRTIGLVTTNYKVLSPVVKKMREEIIQFVKDKGYMNF